MSDREPLLLTTEEAAQVLNCSRWTINRYVRDGLLAATPDVMGRRRITTASLYDLINTRKKKNEA